MSTRFVEFLAAIAPKAFEFGLSMEQLIYQDPASAMVKSRNFLEEIINNVLLEEKLIEDERPQKTLFERINLLSQNRHLNKEIQFLVHDLRKIGNIGAHQPTQDLESALKAHKLVYGVAKWFYESYSKERMVVPDYNFPRPKDNMQEIKEYIDSTFGRLIQPTSSIESIDDNTKTDLEVNSQLSLIELNLNEGESYLVRELKKLQDSSKETIENAQNFSSFKQYLHVERKVQRDLLNIIQTRSGEHEANLIMVCGSVGDGKSHLLAYLKSNYPGLVDKYTIINDATESYSPHMNSLETLKQLLIGFTDHNLNGLNTKTLLAINLGVLHNFLNDDKENEFGLLKRFIEESGLFTQYNTQSFSFGQFDLICIGDYHPYELTANGVQSEFYSGLMSRVFEMNEANPFYQAYSEDKKKNIYTICHFNYELMIDSTMQNSIITLVIETIIRFKLVISARSFLNFLVDIVVVNDSTPFKLLSEFEKLENVVPNLLFNRKDRSEILRHLNMMNPIQYRAPDIDQLTIDLNTLNDLTQVIEKYIPNNKGRQLFSILCQDAEIQDEPFMMFSESVILTAYLMNAQFNQIVRDEAFSTYIFRLYGYNTSNKEIIREVYSEVKESIFKWRGSPRRDYIYISQDHARYKLAQKLHFKPSMNHMQTYKGVVLDQFQNKFVVSYFVGEANEVVSIEIDFSLYKLLRKIMKGYIPNKQDFEDSIKFIEFMDKLMVSGSKSKEILVHVPNENKSFVISNDDFFGYAFEEAKE